MRSWTLVLSIAFHLAAFGATLWAARRPQARKATTVAVVQRPKPKPKPAEDKPEEPPPPPPKPRLAIARPAPAPVAPPAPPIAAAPEPAAPRASGPRFATGLTLGNSTGPGLPTGPAPGSEVPAAGGEPPPPKRNTPPPLPAEPECDQPDTKARVLGTSQVEYPDSARAEGIEGRIQVRVTIADDGSVIGVEVVQGIEPSLDATVVAALKLWRFAPATHCGKPVPGVLTWAQRFELGD